jgi:hypothetical protein
LKIRFQADANLNPSIGLGLQRRAPDLDFRNALGVIPDGLIDSDVLALAARDGRVLVTADVRTMPACFTDFIRHNQSPGLILLRGTMSIGEVINSLLELWESWDSSDLRNQLRWLAK